MPHLGANARRVYIRMFCKTRSSLPTVSFPAAHRHVNHTFRQKTPHVDNWRAATVAWFSWGVPAWSRVILINFMSGGNSQLSEGACRCSVVFDAPRPTHDCLHHVALLSRIKRLLRETLTDQLAQLALLLVFMSICMSVHLDFGVRAPPEAFLRARVAYSPRWYKTRRHTTRQSIRIAPDRAMATTRREWWPDHFSFIGFARCRSHMLASGNRDGL